MRPEPGLYGVTDLDALMKTLFARDSGSDRNGEDPKGLSAEGIAERPAKTGIAQPSSSGDPCQ